MNKLGINIKDFYKYFYKYKIKIERKIDFVNQKALIGIYSFCRIILVIYYLHLTFMLFYSQNMANDENLIKDNHKKKNYLEFTDEYISLAYLGYNIASIIIIILLVKYQKKLLN